MFFLLFITVCAHAFGEALIDVEHPSNPQHVFRTVFSYLSSDELNALDILTPDSISGMKEMVDPNQWEKAINDTANWQDLWTTYKARTAQQCKSLHLNSTNCFNDCIYYNAVLNWIPLILSNDTSAKSQLQRMITFYSMSSGPFSYQDVGNPDMCLFVNGTYCYTPALVGGETLTQHACMYSTHILTG